MMAAVFESKGEVFNGRLGLQQRVLPSYRVRFFDCLASACTDGLSIFAGEPGLNESITTTKQLDQARFYHSRNRHFFQADSPLYGLWQEGLIEWLNGWEPHALVVEANSRYLSSRRAISWMHARGRPVIGWGLGAPPFQPATVTARMIARILKRTRKNFLSSCDALIAYSRRGAEEFRALGIPGDRIFVATNAVASRPTSPAPNRPDSFTQRPVVLFVGRLQARKRIDNLLRACAGLPESLQPRLIIVGDGPARTDYQSLARSIYPQAEFVGQKQGKELQVYLLQADLFVLPGTGGLAVQEAMAYGLPAIVAQGDGTQEDLIRLRNGWLVPPGDLPALQLAMEEALSDPVKLRRMGAESYRIVSEEVNVENMVSVFVHVLNRLINTA
jgi:glycosyltransferase involved in cell wall biosynthesis